MEHRKLNAPVKLSAPLGRNLGHSEGSSFGCVSVFLGVFGALAALLFLAWGVCFMAHIGHEQTLIQNVSARVKEIDKTAPEGLTETDIAGPDSGGNSTGGLGVCGKKEHVRSVLVLGRCAVASKFKLGHYRPSHPFDVFSFSGRENGVAF